ncbi:MAG: hypothetical protein AB4426_10075 [Xenococcaceae cyanobacterium]
MTDQKTAIPSAEDKERALRMLRESNQQLELTTIALDRLIDMVETDLSHQHRQRQGKGSRTTSSSSAT